MAGRLILFKNSVQTIKGDCEADGYKDLLKLDSLTFSSTAFTQSAGSGTVHQSSMQIRLPFGPWVAEIQQRLYHATMLGDVEITEIEQKVDASAKKSWKKIREVKLIDGWIESVNHTWAGIHPTVSMTVQYTDMTFQAGDKISHFNTSEKTS
jgi:hypothetical protein